MNGQTSDPGFAIVVFSGEADLKWLRILKPGFRHCFAVLETQGRWVIYNPLSHRTEIAVIEGASVLEFMRLYRDQRFHVVPWTIPQVRRKPAPWGVYTCVEAVKRVLGIHAPKVITPWNLFIFLKNKKIRKKSLTSVKILVN